MNLRDQLLRKARRTNREIDWDLTNDNATK